MELKLESVKKEDISDLIQLEENWKSIGEEPWTKEHFVKELPGKWELSIKAAYDKKIVGYIIGSIEGKNAKLNKILVDRSYRGHGIGKKLWDEFLSRAIEKNLNVIEFKALIENESAINFYKKNRCIFHGYEIGKDNKVRHLIKLVIKLDNRVAHSIPTIDFFDTFSVTESIRNHELSTGKIVEKFCKKIAEYIGRKFAIATNSGTNALYLSLRALGITEGDEVIMPSYVCSSLLNAVRYCGAVPVVVDINKNDFNISYENAKKRINNKTRAIIIPHMFGKVAREIEDFSNLGIPIIEDCAMSLGAELNGIKAGNFGDIAIFSFYATKMMTTGNGGMVLTSDKNIFEKLKAMTKHDNLDAIGENYNFDMSDIQAALGLSQFIKLESFIKKRIKIAEKYLDIFSESEKDFKIASDLEDFRENVFFRFLIKVQNADNFIKDISIRGVDVAKPVFKPVHYYLNLDDKDFPNTVDAYNTIVSIPIYPSLNENIIENIASILISRREK